MGRGWRLPHGAKLLVSPEQVGIAMRAIVGLRLGASHVIVSQELVPVVLAAVNSLPHKHNVRLKDIRILVYMGGVIVCNTFLQEPMPLLDVQSVVNSTTDAHRGLNPRRHILAA